MQHICHSFSHFLGIFRMLNNGNNLPKDIFRKIIERVYIQPEDKGVRTCDSYVLKKKSTLLKFDLANNLCIKHIKKLLIKQNLLNWF